MRSIVKRFQRNSIPLLQLILEITCTQHTHEKRNKNIYKKKTAREDSLDGWNLCMYNNRKMSRMRTENEFHE